MEERKPHRGRQVVWTQRDVILALWNWEQETGKRPGFNDFKMASRRLFGYPTGDVVVRRFGTWNAAMEAAGYEPIRKSAHRPGTPEETREACLEQIRSVARDLGRQPSYHEYIRLTGNNPNVGHNFGNWGGALRALGWEPLRPGRKRKYGQ